MLQYFRKDGGAILNPGISALRKFIVDTCMEVIRTHDVDAIHFDDYFYSIWAARGALTGSNSILTEPDQATYLKYKPIIIVPIAELIKQIGVENRLIYLSKNY